MPDDLRVNARLTIPAAEPAVAVLALVRAWRAVGEHLRQPELSYDVAGSPSLGPVYRQRALDRLSGRLVDGVLTVSSQTERSQLRNREAAMARLAEALAEAVAPPPAPRRPTRPSRAAKQRRVDTKRRHGQTKEMRRRPRGDD